jgi:hypothetical protein
LSPGFGRCPASNSILGSGLGIELGTALGEKLNFKLGTELGLPIEKELGTPLSVGVLDGTELG